MTGQYSRRVSRETSGRVIRHAKKGYDDSQFEAILALLVLALEAEQGFYVRQYRQSGDFKIKVYHEDGFTDGYLSFWGDNDQEAKLFVLDVPQLGAISHAEHLIAAWLARRAADGREYRMATPTPTNDGKPPQKPPRKSTGLSDETGEGPG